jgi:hypothetical protein
MGENERLNSQLAGGAGRKRWETAAAASATCSETGVVALVSLVKSMKGSRHGWIGGKLSREGAEK